MTWLVTGGAGYIGAHVVAAMRESGERVVILDDLSTGDPGRVPGVALEVGNVLDGDVVARVIRDHLVTGVVHLAARKEVEESLSHPLDYYRVNVEGLRVLLDGVTRAGVGAFVFSSSAAVYGEPDVDAVSEATDCRPVNPYGWTKLVGEQMVADLATVTGLRYACLRFFNVAGCARPELADRGAADLVSMVFRRLGRRRPPVVFGGDHPTSDGTCIRDFVHVADVASAHVAAARAVSDGRVTDLVANIGRGEGVSVRQMIDTIREVTGTAHERWAEPVVAARRAGDPARVVAVVDVAERVLGWRATSGVREMVTSAWEGWLAPREVLARPGDV